MSLELPDWNCRLFALDQPQTAAKPQLGGAGRVKGGAQAPAAAQHRWQAEEAAGLRAEGLGELPNAREAQFWLRKAAAEEQAGRPEAALQLLQEAKERDVRPASDIMRAIQELSKRVQPAEAEPSEDVAGSILGNATNKLAPARFTPSKTGLTGRALRVPSRFARTPGQATAAAAAAAAERAKAGGQLPLPAEPKTLTSVLKRLTFSAAKPALGGAEQNNETPHHMLAKQPGRHVTFGADTMSPAARPAARRQSHVQFQTPQPAINEEEGAESPAPTEVNSINAGRTPYDARLSGLLRKYNLTGTPEAADAAEEDEGEEDGVVHMSPSWKSLSASASVPDSIKGLARRYTSDLDTMSLLSSPGLSPLATTPLLLSAQRQGDGVSPSPPAPTPHHLLEGWLQRNNLYESPTLSAGPAAAPGQPVAEQAPVPSGAVLPTSGEQAGQQQDGPSARAAVRSGSGPLLAGEISPFSGAVHLAAAVPMHAVHSAPEASSPAPTEAATPMTTADIDMDSPLSLASVEAAAGTPYYADGVPRDALGIPLITPATVTVARGAHRSPSPFGDDGLAANLFDSFDSPQAEEFSFAPIASLPLEEKEEEEEDHDTPVMQQRAAADQAGASSGPEPSNETEGQQGSAQEALLLKMPRSIIKSQPLAADGTPLLGKAQRVVSPTKVPRGAGAKELQALMSGLSLGEGGQAQQGMGTLPMLSPVRITGPLRAQLGVGTVVTPVRRSARNQVPHAPVEAMLEQTNFSYVPNEALLPEDATSAKQDKQPKSAKKGSSKGVESEEEEVDQEQAAPNTEARRRQSTRKSRLGAGAGGQPAAAQEQAGGSSSSSQAEPLASRRKSLRLSSMRTPSHGSSAASADDEELAATPAPHGLAAQVPVPQDGSPALQESPAFVAAPSAPATQGRSTRKSARHSTPAAATPATLSAGEPATQRTTRRRASMAAAAAATATAATPQAVPLSPTEQGIRTALRRSARKSMGRV